MLDLPQRGQPKQYYNIIHSPFRTAVCRMRPRLLCSGLNLIFSPERHLGQRQSKWHKTTHPTNNLLAGGDRANMIGERHSLPNMESAILYKSISVTSHQCTIAGIPSPTNHVPQQCWSLSLVHDSRFWAGFTGARVLGVGSLRAPDHGNDIVSVLPKGNAS